MTAKPGGSLPPILRGMGLIARGRAEGLNCFRDTPRAVLFSLTPGLGVLAAAVFQRLTGETGTAALNDIPGTLCVLLAPAVLSFELARFWGREAFWGRYITAFNWCQWLLPAAGLCLVLLLGVAKAAGLAGSFGPMLLFAGLACYAMWLNWFIARHALALSRPRAAGFVLAVNLGTMAIILLPTLLAGWRA